MANCECMAGCPFFNDKMPDTSGLGSMFKRRYCQGDSAACARYTVFKALGKPRVPSNLYPNQMDVAKQLIGK